jgi:hypothetical protein
MYTTWTLFPIVLVRAGTSRSLDQSPSCHGKILVASLSANRQRRFGLNRVSALKGWNMTDCLN